MTEQEAIKHFFNKAVDEKRLDIGFHWEDLYHAVKGHDNQLMSEGLYAEYLTDISGGMHLLRILQRWYLQEFIDKYYLTFGDLKCGNISDEEQLPLCPVTGQRIKNITISDKLIQSLNKLWDKFFGTNYHDRSQKEVWKQLPGIHTPEIMACLLKLTWHMENAGSKFKISFRSKWEQLKTWNTEWMGARTLKYFFVLGFFSTCKIQPYMVADKIRPLYIDAWEYFNTCDFNKEFPIMNRGHKQDHPKFALAEEAIVAYEYHKNYNEKYPEYAKELIFNEKSLKPFRVYLKRTVGYNYKKWFWTDDPYRGGEEFWNT